jgi:mono/diheme cytochrome c family protein
MLITPLMAAVIRPDSTKVVKLLLVHGAETTVKVEALTNEFFQSSLVGVAAWNGDLEQVNLFLEKGVKPVDVIKPASKGHKAIVERLLEVGADVDGFDPFFGNALIASLYGQWPDISKLLIEHGANLEARSPFGQHETPVMLWAAYNETDEASVAKLLIEKGVDPNTMSVLGETALDWARDRNNKALETVLLEAGGQAGTKAKKNKIIPDHPLPAFGEDLNPIIRDSITRAVDLLQINSDGFLNSGVVQEQKCVSCHQETSPVVAFNMAIDRGFEVDKTSIARQTQDHVRYWTNDDDIAKAYEMIPPQPDAPIVVGYGLMGLAASKYPADELTEAMARYLIAAQYPDGSSSSNEYRPPMEDGPILGVTFAVGGIQAYPVPALRSQTKEVLSNARKYLHKAEPMNLNQELHQLLGLGWAGELTSRLRPYVKAILAQQQTDGGWTQVEGNPSDAWATGLALYTLNAEGGIKTSHEAFQNGVRCLLRTQFEDGSWFVKSRSWPFQPRFESGFPHGKDQWISAGGTSWAAMALLLTQPEVGETESTDWMVMEVPENYAKKVKVAQIMEGSSADAPPFDYHRDIRPIFERSCTGCHGSDLKKIKGGFNIDKRESFLTGGQSFDPVAIIGQAADSDLIWMVSDQLEDLEMPPLFKREKYEALSSDEVELLKAWVDQGLPWEEKDDSDNL